MGGRILVVDDDPVVARFLAGDLTNQGHEVDLVTHADALHRATTTAPDLVLLDAGCDGGLEVVRGLREHPLTAWLPVIVLRDGSSPQATAVALAAGADDCLSKPFDTLELSARVAGTLRRSADVRALSPLTGLPGNHRIEVEVASRAAAGLAYAVCHVDLDEFKGFNDVYGFQRGDALLLLLAACLHRAVLRVPGTPAFLGHVGGDDFIVVCTPEQAELLAATATEEFDGLAPAHYDPEDAKRGHLETIDRRGEARRQPLVSVSIGIGVHRGGPGDHRTVVAAAGEMKSVAKRTPGSHVAVDRRT